MFYALLTRPLDDDARTEVDAILGDSEAVAERARARRETILGAGVEVA